MTSLQRKYKRQASGLFLAVYLSFFAMNLFHIHCIDLSISSHRIPGGAISNFSADPYSDGDSHCLLSLLANSIHSYYYSDENLFSALRQIGSAEFHIIQYFNKSFLYIALLRAPPEKMFTSFA
ncbi:MAG: hypothetical protein Q8858_11220 [Bacteroidota bacterium]|nr:hypothetical protein [Bacteroidota bacterium]